MNRQHPTHLHIQRLQCEIDILRHHGRPPCMPHKLLGLLNNEIDPVLYISCNGSTGIIRDLVDTTRFCDILSEGAKVLVTEYGGGPLQLTFTVVKGYMPIA